LMPSALAELFYGRSQEMVAWTTVAPGPDENELREFEASVKQYRWQTKRTVHPIFQTVFTEQTSFLQFIWAFSRQGALLVVDTVQKHSTRDGVLAGLVKDMNRLPSANSKLDHFIIHHFMRTVEFCCQEPFGPAVEVLGGSGGKDGAKMLLTEYREMAEHGEREETNDDELDCIGEEEVPASDDAYGAVIKKIAQATDDELKAISRFFVEWLNKRVKDRLDGEDTRDALKLELDAIGLEWCPKRKRVVHNWGIKKEFDATDAEHFFCGGYMLRRHVLPERHISKDPKMDRDKFAPMAVRSSGLYVGHRVTLCGTLLSTSTNDVPELVARKIVNDARELPMFAGLVKRSKLILKAFLKLLEVEDGEHSKLAEIFQMGGEER